MPLSARLLVSLAYTRQLARPPLTLLGYIGRAVAWAFSALDRAFASLAVPFGAHIRQPARRYAVLLGAYAVIYLLALLPVPVLPLVALGVGYVGVLAIGRAWVLNEKQRTAI